jgi:hypothetical protein
VRNGDERFFWLRRLRWRLKGAWLVPAFFVAVALDTLVVWLLPFSGDRSIGPVGSFLIVAFLNLLVVAVVAPLAGIWLRRRSPTLPAFAARDRAGVAALGVLSIVFLAAGVLHRPAITGQQDEVVAQAAAAREWFHRQAPSSYLRNLWDISSWKAGPELYRTCLPGPDPSKAICVYVNTDQDPPGVSRDPSQEPNATLVGPDNPGSSLR